MSRRRLDPSVPALEWFQHDFLQIVIFLDMFEVEPVKIVVSREERSDGGFAVDVGPLRLNRSSFASVSLAETTSRREETKNVRNDREIQSGRLCSL